MANNLAKSSVIACVALSGYNVVFKAEEREIEEQSEQQSESDRPKEIQGKAEVPPVVIPPAASSYTSNAANVLQNNQTLTSQLPHKVEPASPGEDASESEENGASITSKSFNSKYTVSGSPQNIVVKSILDILLTPFIANKLAIEPESEVLKILTQNTRNPYLIWDNATRTQLLDFLEYQRQHSSKEQYADITDIYNTTSKFVYDATRDELKIGGVYIRIYNEMPTFPIQNPKMFVLDLLEYLKQAHIYLAGKQQLQQRSMINTSNSSPQKIGQLPKPLIPTPVKQSNNNNNQQQNLDNILNDYNRSKIKHQLVKNENGMAKINYDFANDAKFTEHLIMVFNSLISVIKLNPNVELQCIGNFDILFGFLNTNIQEQVSELNIYYDKKLLTFSPTPPILFFTSKELFTGKFEF